MFALFVRHTGTLAQLHHVLRRLEEEENRKCWRTLYLLAADAAMGSQIKALCRRSNGRIIPLRTTHEDWPSASNRMLPMTEEHWICSLETAQGGELLDALPKAVLTAQAHPGISGIRILSQNRTPPALYCWNSAALQRREGWPQKEVWPFPDMADDFVWTALRKNEKCELEVNTPVSRKPALFWEKKRQMWVSTFLSHLSPSPRQTIPPSHVESPIVSILLSVYNEQSRLPWTLNSVLYQTMPHFEVIAINDGSTDHTEEVLRAFSDPRIRVISRTSNRGKAHRLNEALTYAQGGIIFELDGDDWLGPEALHWAITSLEPLPEDVAFIYGDRVFWHEGTEAHLTVRHEEEGEQIRSQEHYLQQLNPVGPRVYRKHALQKAGGWPVDAFMEGRLYEDVRVVLHLLGRFRARYVPGAHYHVRMRANSMSNRHKACFNEWKKQIQAQMRDG